MKYSFFVPKLISLGLVVLLTSLCGTKTLPTRVSPAEFWEPIFFRTIDETTRVANLKPLREVALGASDIEVRIWRGFGLTNLEGVVLGRIDGEWSATHLQTNSYSKKTKVVRTEMLVPKGGWDKFWNELEGLGLLSIKGTNLGQECRVLDGIAHVVETSIDGVYRTYTYPSGVQRCDGSLQMDVISETIGIEFNDGAKECTDAEWFPCASLLRRHRLNPSAKTRP